jgi:prepilin-type N-terminal cleavage/methylation domain-containing protein
MQKPLILTRHLKNLKQQAFSLIELMAVLAIISILTVLVFLNAPSMLGAIGFTQGSRLVLDTLNYARENAVTKSVPTVVVIRTTGANAWQRLAVFSAPANSTGSSNWAQVSQWQNLSQRAFIDSTYDPSTEPWTSPANSIAQSPVVAPSSPIQDGGTPLTYKTDYYAVGFLPDGSLQNTNNIAIRIVKGRSQNGVITIEKDSGGQPVDWVKLIIVQIRGHIKEIRKGQ